MTRVCTIDIQFLIRLARSNVQRLILSNGNGNQHPNRLYTAIQPMRMKYILRLISLKAVAKKGSYFYYLFSFALALFA